MSTFASLLANLQDWGYWIVFVGSIFEGEVILVSASAAAALGYLDIRTIFCIAFVTTVLVDQGLFFLGRRMGTDWIVMKIPKLAKAREKAFVFLRKMDILFIFSFRFIYGIRTISPLIIGSAHIKPIRFIVCNFFSGALWAGLGCAMGAGFAQLIASEKFHTWALFACLSALLILVFLITFLLLRRRKH